MGKSKRRHLSPDEQQILEHLQVRLLAAPKDTARCDQLIVEHHYLHEATLVGEQLRYVATYKGRWLALATWSGAAFHIKDRDEFIGWDSEQCRRRRPLLANNSRLLVLPECHSPNLISRFMKLMLEPLSQDWLGRWGHPLALVESFVDPQLYQGTAYKVSGWLHLGKTAGWKRDAADFYIKHDAPKQIWVRELVKKACLKLRAPQLPPEWAMVEAAARAHCTTPVKEIRSLMDSVRRELPEFRRAQALGYPLAGMITEAKSNEIPAARQVLKRLDLTGKIVLSDAAHTQVETGQQILYEQGGDYLMTVKGNQPTLQATLQDLFEKRAFPPSGLPTGRQASPRTRVLRREHNRGRLEIRFLQCLEVNPSQVGFPGARLAARLETRVKRGGEWTREVVFLLSSLTLEQLQALGMLQLKRHYWVIESRLGRISWWPASCRRVPPKSLLRTYLCPIMPYRAGLRPTNAGPASRRQDPDCGASPFRCLGINNLRQKHKLVG